MIRLPKASSDWAKVQQKVTGREVIWGAGHAESPKNGHFSTWNQKNKILSTAYSVECRGLYLPCLW